MNRVFRISSFFIAVMILLFSGNSVFAMGDNGGVRLLLHVDERNIPEGAITSDPCDALPPISSVDDLVVDYFGESDSVWIWTYLAHPAFFAVKAVGYSIDYQGVKILTSGTCSPFVMQQAETMGKWAESGSAIAFGWGPEGYPEGILEPVNWFFVERLEPDAYFRVYEGNHSMSGEVGDTNSVPCSDPIWKYGKIGFGEIQGELPMPGDGEIPGAAGGFQLSFQ